MLSFSSASPRYSYENWFVFIVDFFSSISLMSFRNSQSFETRIVIDELILLSSNTKPPFYSLSTLFQYHCNIKKRGCQPLFKKYLNFFCTTNFFSNTAVETTILFIWIRWFFFHVHYHSI